MVTASVLVAAPNFARMEATWNFIVCSERPRRSAMRLLAKPRASIASTSRSRAVRDSVLSPGVASVKPPVTTV
jgi:hypothetical protein